MKRASSCGRCPRNIGAISATDRNAVLRDIVHMVELDFLLGGNRLPMRRPLPPVECFAIVSRHHTRPDAEVYAWSLRAPLAAIRIPLRAPDPDLILDLAAIYEETFRRGRYERKLHYDRPLAVPLPQASADWIAQMAQEKQMMDDGPDVSNGEAGWRAA
jgi:hypothetical protein